MGMSNNPKTFFFLAIAKNLTLKTESITRLYIYIITILSSAISQIIDINKKILYFNDFRIIH